MYARMRAYRELGGAVCEWLTGQIKVSTACLPVSACL
jgi:hypothetical protein